MLKKITSVSLLATFLITFGCFNKVPEGFVSFTDADLGLSFRYPPHWGEVEVNRPATNLVSFSFDNEEIEPPLITLLQKADTGNSTGFFTSFNQSAEADCELLKTEHQQIVTKYKATENADTELVSVLEQNAFACEALNLNKQAQFLFSKNILQVDKEQVPKLVPLAEYRFVFGKELAYQSGVAVQPVDKSAEDLEAVLKSLEITKTDTFNTEKRARPETSSYKKYDQHELVSFSYPLGWEVKPEGDVLLVAPADRSNSAEPVPLKIKVWPNASYVDMNQFKQVVMPVTRTLSGENWEVFKNFPGVYALDLWFLPYQDKMIEVTTLASADTNYNAKTETILKTLTLK